MISPSFATADIQLRAQIFAAHLSNVFAQAKRFGVIAAKRFRRTWEGGSIPKTVFVFGVARFLEAF